MPAATRLADLLASIPAARLVSGSGETPVRGVTNDTRRLAGGEVFVAIRGERFDGLALAPRAVELGASAVVAEAAPRDPLPVPLVLVPRARAALADFAAAYYGHPSRALQVVGVTGTDGKTSTTYLVSAILEAHGLRTGWLTTVSTRVGAQARSNAAEHTTPEAPLVQATLAEMRDAGVQVAVLETSSHALAMDRVRGVAYRVGVFTNLSPEHLNFHGTLEAYREAKSLLFRALPPDGLAVLNADDPSSAAMRAATAAPTCWYSLNGEADLWATDIRLEPDGTSFVLHQREGAPGERATTVRTRLIGRFNVANWLAAFGAARYFGARAADLERACAAQDPVPGRMNLVARGQSFAVVVDFAHTPQALEKALETVRSLTSGRVLLVFGLAGGRDFNNRPVMGAQAARLADFTAISMDDPGEEDPAQIAEAIAAGAASVAGPPGERYAVQVDRRAAIREVLRRARSGDVVLLAGKGHEQRMVVGTDRLPWNDARVAAEELERLGFGGR